jgi:hypothetical protein
MEGYVGIGSLDFFEFLEVLVGRFCAILGLTALLPWMQLPISFVIKKKNYN